jgi:hypothetical protein
MSEQTETSDEQRIKRWTARRRAALATENRPMHSRPDGELLEQR